MNIALDKVKEVGIKQCCIYGNSVCPAVWYIRARWNSEAYNHDLFINDSSFVITPNMVTQSSMLVSSVIYFDKCTPSF